jgi:hypothetical protein
MNGLSSDFQQELVMLVKQGPLTLQDHQHSPLFCCGFLLLNLLFSVLLDAYGLSFSLSALLRFTASDYPFGMYKLLLLKQ